MKCTRIMVFAWTCIALAGVAHAENGYLSAFVARYPTSTLPARMAGATGSQCNVCHSPPSRSSAGNCYKDALAARLSAGRTIAQALADVENADSDNDGVNNVTEILTVRTDSPNGVGYNPGLRGATGADPCGTSSSVTNQVETPPPPGPVCDSIDFNNDTLFPDTSDIDDFLSVFSGGPCSTDPNPGCNDIDYNNDSLFPDTLDIDAFLSVFSGGPCLV